MGPVSQSSRQHWSGPRLAFAAVLIALVAGLLVAAHRFGLKSAVEAVILSLRETGPLAFFLAMALLPAVGFPMLAFVLAAGPVFGPVLGPGWVIAWSLAAVVINLLLSYWLAARALRPLVSRLLAWYGFPLRDPAAPGAWQTTLLVRLTPGPPFWAQSYLLGLLRVPLFPYLAVSTGVMAGGIFALVYGGEAITAGNGRLAFVAIAVGVAAIAALHLLRLRTNRRAALAACPAK